MHDARTGLERDAGEIQAKLFADPQVHLVVHQPQGHLRNLRGELFNFDTVELVHVDADQAVHVHALLAGVAAELMAGAQHLQLQQTQFAVADDEEISAAAGGVEKREAAQFFVELEQTVAVVFGLFELGAQVIQKQWTDQLEDVFLTGVVRAQVAAGLGVHDALEQAAKDGGADGRPVERACIEQRLAHGGGEISHGQRFFKQLAVDVGKGGQLRIERGAALGLRCVEHLKHLRQARTQVRTVGRGTFFDEGTKCLRGLKDAGVVGKQTKQQAHQ